MALLAGLTATAGALVAAPAAGQESADGGGEFMSVSVGDDHTCALTIDGTVTCWGNNSHGQADAPDGQHTAVSAGNRHTCALTIDGTVTCWGNNSHGQADAPDGQHTAVSAGSWTSCALRPDGTAECWGRLAVVRPAA